MEREDIVISTDDESKSAENEIVTTVEDETDYKGKKQRKHGNMRIIVITAVITIFATMALTTVLFFSRFGGALNFASRYYKLYEIENVINSCYIGETDSESLLDYAASGLVAGTGDQWSSYLSADELASYSANLANSYVGIGVTVTKEDGAYIYVSKVDENGGAYETGIQVGDYIKAVDGTDIKDKELSEVTELIKGEEGTTVALTIVRNGEELSFTAERRSIAEHSMEYEMIGNVGYVKLLNFYDNSGDEFIAAVDDLISQGAQSFVFDVRFNGGGYLKELMKMLDYLLPEGVIFQMEDINGEITTTESDASCIDMPIAVLINDNTISAAEYFAAAIREYDRGSLVGTPTMGKGYSQRLFYLSDGSAINLSNAKYYTPKGECLAGVGLTPDVEIDIDYEEYYGVYYGTLSHEEDSQLQAALESVK